MQKINLGISLKKVLLFLLLFPPASSFTAGNRKICKEMRGKYFPRKDFFMLAMFATFACKNRHGIKSHVFAIQINSDSSLYLCFRHSSNFTFLLLHIGSLYWKCFSWSCSDAPRARTIFIRRYTKKQTTFKST